MTARAVHWADSQDDYRSPCGADAGDDQVVFNHLYAYRVTCRACKAARAAVGRRDRLTRKENGEA